MARYFHAVRLDEEKCKGCTNCIKRCPTEAIRVRDGKARIIEERCIDCGECIRVCPNHAKNAFTDEFSRRNKFAWNIALPAPALFGQFKQLHDPGAVLEALKALGFDSVFAVPQAADYVTLAMRDFLEQHGPGPWISSSCPAVVRFIQVRFPELIPSIMPLESPMEIAGMLARQQAAKELDIASEQIGVWFITPCPAKVTAIHQPVARGASNLTGAFSIADLYGELLKLLPDRASTTAFTASGLGLGWGRAGGENVAVAVDSHLAVDGIHNLVSLLEELEMGRLKDINFLECQACPEGCVGGALTVENPFVARVRLRKMAEQLPKEIHHLEDDYPAASAGDVFKLTGSIEPRPIMQLAENMLTAIQKMEQLSKIEEALPGLDCGACGSPNCRALAEDIVRGIASETDCVIKLRERVKDLASEMLDLAKKLPPAMGKGDSEEDDWHAG